MKIVLLRIPVVLFVILIKLLFFWYFLYVIQGNKRGSKCQESDLIYLYIALGLLRNQKLVQPKQFNPEKKLKKIQSSICKMNFLLFKSLQLLIFVLKLAEKWEFHIFFSCSITYLSSYITLGLDLLLSIILNFLMIQKTFY